MAGFVPSSFPPSEPTSLKKPIPSYLFQEYSDDDTLQTFAAAFNAQAQSFVDWFNALNLPIYTGLSGALLDWVAQGLYGISRPQLAISSQTYRAAYNTLAYNTTAYNAEQLQTTASFLPVTDDTFQRIITWHFYKGDGPQYSTRWLKRRIHRFLNGAGGRPGIVSPAGDDNTYDVSVAYSGATVTITLANSPIAQIFQYAVDDGVVALPFQYSYVVAIGTIGGGSSLTSPAGILVSRGVPPSLSATIGATITAPARALTVRGVTPSLSTSLGNSGAFAGAANLKQWLAADNVNNTASVIVDKSGNGHVATQSVVASQPTITTAPNGHRLLSFDGTDDYLINNSLAGLITGAPLGVDLHFVAVVGMSPPTGPGDYQDILSFTTAADTDPSHSTQWIEWYVQDTVGGSNWSCSTGGTTYVNPEFTSSVPTGALQLVEMIMHANGTMSLSVNGAPYVTSTTAATGSLTFTMGAIGAVLYSNGATIQLATMRLAELATAVGGVWTGTDLQSRLQELANYWGLGLTIPLRGGVGGTMGNSGAFTGTANLKQWVASDNASNIASTLADKSGGGHTMTQSFSGAQASNVAATNGRNLLSFNGSSTYYNNNPMASVVSGPPVGFDQHYLMVVGPDASDSFPKIYSFTTVNDTNQATIPDFMGAYVQNSGQGWVGLCLWAGGNGTWENVTAPAADGNLHLLEVINHANGTLSVAIDGGAYGTCSVRTGSVTFTMGALGATLATDGSAGSFCSMRFAEFAMISRVLTGTELQTSAQALSDHWGLGLTIPLR